MALISGTQNSDTLSGTSKNDTVEGFGGDDILDAGAGNDLLVGDGSENTAPSAPNLIRLDADSFNSSAAEITFDGAGTNPVITVNGIEGIGDVQVSFGGWFLGQAPNTLSGGVVVTLGDHSPTEDSALALDPASSQTFGTNDTASPTSPVLSGSPQFNGPVSVLFDKPVSAVGLDGGYFNAIGATSIEAFDANGNSLGSVTNSAEGIEFFGLAIESGEPLIKGISFYITGDEPGGFAIDNLHFGGVASINEFGNDTLNGGAGNDSLDGGPGDDVMLGGKDDDVYFVDSTGDIVTESAGEGSDTVVSTVSYTLGDDVENLILAGDDSINGAGNDLKNVVTGNGAGNFLNGRGGNDTVLGGDGDDTLQGDGVESDVDAEEVTVSNQGTIPSSGQTLAISLSGPTVAANGQASVSGLVSRSTVSSSGVNIAYIVDISGSMADTFESSTSVGDQNGDGYSEQLIDAAILGFKTLNESLLASGQSAANVQLIAFDDSAYVKYTGTVGADSNLNGQADIEDQLQQLEWNGGTYFEPPLQQAINFFQSSPSGSNYVFFMSDGYPADSGNYGDEVSTLTDPSGINATIRSFGLGQYANMTELDQIDDGTANNSSVQVLDPGTLSAALSASPVASSDIQRVELYKDGELAATIQADQLVSTPLGLSFSYDFSGITADADIQAKVIANDTAATSVDVLFPIAPGAVASGNDLLLGGNGNDIVLGDAGDDTLDGGADDDTLDGGDGNDVFQFAGSGPGDKIVRDRAGVDVIDGSADTTGATIDLHAGATSSINGFSVTIDSETSTTSASSLDLAFLWDLSGSFSDDISNAKGEATDIVSSIQSISSDAHFGLASFVDKPLSPFGDPGDYVYRTDLSLTGDTTAFSSALGGLTVLGGGDTPEAQLEGLFQLATRTAELGFRADATKVALILTDAPFHLAGDGAGATVPITTPNNGDTVLDGNGTGEDYPSIAQLSDALQAAGITPIFAVTDEVLSTYEDLVSRLGVGTTASLSSDSSNLISIIQTVLPEISGTVIENAIGGSGNDLISGNLVGNSIRGGSGDDTINGLEGADSLFGEDGDDDLYGDAGNDYLYGGDDSDMLWGGDGRDTLNGGAGGDIMNGGAGDDLYIVDTAGDAVIDDSGIDTVRSSVSYVLARGLENLILGSNTDINGTGNSLANMITSNSGDNLLDGKAGADTMDGGAGNDTYVVDSAADVVSDSGTQASETDVVESSVSYTLGSSLEALVLTGSSAINGTGNSYSNLLVGNSAANLLDGSYNADTMIGGAGNDTYVVNHVGDIVIETSTLSSEIDLVQSSVSFTLGSNLENLVLTGSKAINGFGNSAANMLVGNSAANLLDGSYSADTMIGGAGNDTYVVNNVGDVVSETSTKTSEVDIVESSVGFTLGANLEGLVLTGSGSVNGFGNGLMNLMSGNSGQNVLAGGGGDDTLDGGAGNDSLSGSSGNDSLAGGGGADSMSGGSGNDTYVVDSSGDVVSESNSAITEIDLVQSSVNYTLGSNLENLTLIGAGVRAFGNGRDNVLTGNAAANLLNGGYGADTMAGGDGDDTYVVDNAGDVVSERNGSTGGIDVVQSSRSYTMGSYLENLILTGTAETNGLGNGLDNAFFGNGARNILSGGGGNDTLYGNSGNDSLSGSSGNDFLSGGSGSDTMLGGTGDDTYVVDTTGDVVVEAGTAGSEIDLVQSSVSYTLGANIENLTLTGTGANSAVGNSLGNVLTGNGAANLLDGQDGADSMFGGAGNDTYAVNSASDIVKETSTLGSETDLVKSSITYTLGSNLENLILIGSEATDGFGNGRNNLMLGNGGRNRLSGGGGNDTLAGNSGNDSLSGSSGDDSLNGGTGTDTMIGGTGNDTYVVDTAGDKISETSTLQSEIDVVQSGVTYTLGNNLENLILTGSGSTSGSGNELNNAITGNSAANSLSGFLGDDILVGNGGSDTLTGANAKTGGTGEIDTLSGGSGSDLFVLGNSSGRFYDDRSDSTIGASDYALVTDFKVGEDSLQLRGNASSYYLAASPVSGVDGSGLFFKGGVTDELIAVLRSGDSTVLTDTNTIGTARFV